MHTIIIQCAPGVLVHSCESMHVCDHETCKALYSSSATCNSLSCLVIANWSAHAPAFNPILVLKSRSSMHHRHPWLHQTIWSNFQRCHSSIEVMDGMRWFSGMIWFDERFNLFFPSPIVMICDNPEIDQCFPEKNECTNQWWMLWELKSVCRSTELSCG